MKKIDLLYEVYKGQLTEEEADAIVGQAIDSDLLSPIAFLGMDLGTEWTALCFNRMPYKVIAQWRYEGWPTTCVICKKKIDLEKGRWWCYEKLELFGKVYNNVMAHVDCRNEAATWN